MSDRIRVLLVDDSIAMRKMIGKTLVTDPVFEIYGEAADGVKALALLEKGLPDAMVLDVEMPNMDGLATVREVRKRYPKLPIIMFSSLTERGASATLDALSSGADDYVAKPSGSNGFAGAQQTIRETLMVKLKLFARRKPALPAAVRKIERQTVHRTVTQRVDILAIGVSTGGPNALAAIVEKLPPQLRVPVVITQHMPPVFTRHLAQRLDGRTALTVREAQDGDRLEQGGIWIAPGDFHMQIIRNGLSTTIRLQQEPPENSCRPAVDVMFRSLADSYGARTLAVVLTGMGKDGLAGCTLLRERNAQIIAQDEATSVVWGMPGHVAKAGLADRILPLDDIVPDIMTRLSTTARPLRLTGTEG